MSISAMDYTFKRGILSIIGRLMFIVVASSAISSSSLILTNPSPDPNGYIVYCPCMGRFGNQADQFLGVLAFAKGINRTMVVPPWVEYRDHMQGTVMVPYSKYFKLETLLEFHRVVSMEVFMEKLADTVWPIGQRTVFCYSARQGPDKGQECNAKDGNPFGTFWNWFNVDFDKSEIFEPLFYDMQNSNSMAEWMRIYPASKFPVLAFVGAPAAFPIVRSNVRLHRYVQWSEEYNQKADDFIAQKFGSRSFLAIHLRNGRDFERACKYVTTSPSMFAAEQCIGRGGRYGTTTKEMCFPSINTVTQQVVKELESAGFKMLFIATDNNSLRKEFRKVLPDVKIVMQEGPVDPHLDLAVMGRAERFIGNCVSTYTAFVKRERDQRNLTSSFWAFERKDKREEL